MESLFKKTVILLTLTLFSLSVFVLLGVTEDRSLSATDLMPGLPVGGGSEEADLDLCPQGAHVIDAFLAAWRKGDYRTMYDLIDDDSKKDYPFEKARFDLMTLEFKEYKISSVRKDGENFEFILSYGNWKDGDKDTLKAIISGKTFKMVMPAKNSPFKRSAETGI